MIDKKLAKLVKKLIYSNRFTMEDISHMAKKPIEECVEAYTSYYGNPIPPSLFIVGNIEARQQLKELTMKGEKILLTGPNGVGKTSAVRELANNLDLILKICNPLKQEDIVEAFGRAPTNEVDGNLYVIECDSLPKRYYSTLLEYVKNSKRPLILIAKDKKTIHGNVLKHLQPIIFTTPSYSDIEIFLKKKYNWDGDIEDVYSQDMREVLEKVFGDMGINKPEEQEEFSAEDVALELGYGYFDKEDFNQLKDPLWFVIRWLAYNQDKKFPNKQHQLENLKKLSIIDRYKFTIRDDILKEMLLNLKTSPRRIRMSFPPFQKKEKQEEKFEKIKKPTGFKPKKIEENKPKVGVDFRKWF